MNLKKVSAMKCKVCERIVNNESLVCPHCFGIFYPQETKIAFGDIVFNSFASPGNPTRVLMVVRLTKKYIHCLSLDGEEINHYNGDRSPLRKIGSVDFAEWRHLAVISKTYRLPELPIRASGFAGSTIR